MVGPIIAMLGGIAVLTGAAIITAIHFGAHALGSSLGYAPQTSVLFVTGVVFVSYIFIRKIY